MIEFSRNRLAEVAEREARSRHTADMPANAGEKVEPFLAPFRAALDANAAVRQFTDTGVGYSWCGAFVHWCCRQAGLDLPLQPAGQPHTYALVRTWRLWSQEKGIWHDEDDFVPQRGDIVVFRNLSRPLRDDCHIGVVAGVGGRVLYSAEGNVVFGPHGEGRRTQLKRRLRGSARVMGFIRLEE